jgi:hypothetical protein
MTSTLQVQGASIAGYGVGNYRLPASARFMRRTHRSKSALFSISIVSHMTPFANATSESHTLLQEVDSHSHRSASHSTTANTFKHTPPRSPRPWVPKSSAISAGLPVQHSTNSGPLPLRRSFVRSPESKLPPFLRERLSRCLLSKVLEPSHHSLGNRSARPSRLAVCAIGHVLSIIMIILPGSPLSTFDGPGWLWRSVAWRLTNTVMGRQYGGLGARS